jgi:hypothetical protein
MSGLQILNEYLRSLGASRILINIKTSSHVALDEVMEAELSSAILALVKRQHELCEEHDVLHLLPLQLLREFLVIMKFPNEDTGDLVELKARQE